MTGCTRLRIDTRQSKGPLVPFWRSTGFSPAELLLEPEMQQTLTFVGAVPNAGIEFVRVHYMLDLVSASGLGAYDWSRLDRAIDVMLERRLRPFFELMGNPSYLFTDFNERDQVHHWRDFMVALAERCRDRCGIDEVRRWYFETWNEPDIWWKLGGETGFNNYYDACSEALRAVDPELRFGGPGVARRLPPIFKSLLKHCDTGRNFFTGETGVRIDFISVHEKGAKKHPEDITPNSLGICRHEMMAVDYVRKNHPRFAHLPFINNECDPQIGWQLYHTWHATPYFAGIAAKIINQHQRVMIEGESVNYGLLSNDNGFMGGWGHRTHLTYFGKRAFRLAQSEHKTDLGALDCRVEVDEPFDLVKKPALSVMELLALLGDKKLAVAGDALNPDENGLGLVATGTKGGAAALLYNSVDRIWQSGERQVELTIEGLEPGTYAIATFMISDGKGDPFSVWEALGAPDDPTPDELAAMRAAQEPALTTEIAQVGADGALRRNITLALPGVALVVVEKRGDAAPAPVRTLKITRQKALHGGVNALLFWDAEPDSNVRLYDVLRSEREQGPYVVVNPIGLLSTVYVSREDAGPAFYKVRSRDLFGRVSEAT
ncbi:GH39 family glycosyl hydrolase [Terrarubrum flagellatum]|uniref:GH39 family glycosyl hydrolase n=1 Tax=Terrirubrum flagellatum TaxID=2895980 RepID=UPI0031455A3D